MPQTLPVKSAKVPRHPFASQFIRRLASIYAATLPRLDRAEERLDRVEVRLDQVEGHIRSLQSHVESGLKESWARFESVGGDLHLVKEAVDAGRDVLDATVARQRELASTAEKVAASLAELRGSVENLTRTWLRSQNDIDALRAESARAFGELTRLEELQHQQYASLRDELSASVKENELRGERVDQTLRFLLDRVEFVRRETMFEMRYASPFSGGGGRKSGLSQPKVLNGAKLESAEKSGTVRLNLGCGHISLESYINVDQRQLPGVDVQADVGALPFEPESVSEISSAHLVEHFPQEELRRRLLPHWRMLLKSGGTLRCITPDGTAMLQAVQDGSYSFADFRDALFGGQEYEGDFHYNMLTPESLSILVEETGFTDIEVPVRGRRNGQCFEFELVARRS